MSCLQGIQFIKSAHGLNESCCPHFGHSGLCGKPGGRRLRPRSVPAARAVWAPFVLPQWPVPGGPSCFQMCPDLAESYGKLFWGNVILEVGVVVQAVLTLTGGIVVFAKLGKEEPGKTGAILMAIGLGLSILTAAVAFIIVSQVGETISFKTEEVLASFLIKGFAGNILPTSPLGSRLLPSPSPYRLRKWYT